MRLYEQFNNFVEDLFQKFKNCSIELDYCEKKEKIDTVYKNKHKDLK